MVDHQNITSTEPIAIEILADDDRSPIAPFVNFVDQRLFVGSRSGRRNNVGEHQNRHIRFAHQLAQRDAVGMVVGDGAAPRLLDACGNIIGPGLQHAFGEPGRRALGHNDDQRCIVKVCIPGNPARQSDIGERHQVVRMMVRDEQGGQLPAAYTQGSEPHHRAADRIELQEAVPATHHNAP